MSFYADKQTLDDLNLLGKYKPNSIYSLFNQVRTAGGEKVLDHLFHAPLTDAVTINKRSEIFRWFAKTEVEFPVANEQALIMENYLGGGGGANYIVSAAQIGRKKLLASVIRDEAFGILYKGLLATIEVLNVFRDFIINLDGQEPMGPYQEQLESVKRIFADKRLRWLAWERRNDKIPLQKVIRYDYLLRQALQEEMRILTDVMYDIDMCIAVSHVGRIRGFSYALALPRESNLVKAGGLRHPSLAKAVANSVSLRQDSNVLFLTGANMAGKSTFMKTFGISVYLAHMGFPVAADEMVFSVKDGIYTSINVPDNLNQGYSHFYAEVLRVKKVAEEVTRPLDLYVIFDELFKGTNVKDAYDATLTVTQAFAGHRNCFYIISTHIIEVGDVLRQECDNLQFVYFPTIMKGSIPVYPYTLKEGITADRHGMMIIENEGILNIILSREPHRG